jgi:hypothetical protein
VPSHHQEQRSLVAHEALFSSQLQTGLLRTARSCGYLLRRKACAVVPLLPESFRFSEGLLSRAFVTGPLIEAADLIMNASVFIGG